MAIFFPPPIPKQGWSLPFFQVLLTVLGRGHAQVLLDELAEKREVGKVKVVINFEMYSVFMSYGAGVKILSPQVAVTYIHNQLSQAAASYNTTDQ